MPPRPRPLPRNAGEWWAKLGGTICCGGKDLRGDCCAAFCESAVAGSFACSESVVEGAAVVAGVVESAAPFSDDGAGAWLTLGEADAEVEADAGAPSSVALFDRACCRLATAWAAAAAPFELEVGFAGRGCLSLFDSSFLPPPAAPLAPGPEAPRVDTLRAAVLDAFDWFEPDATVISALIGIHFSPVERTTNQSQERFKAPVSREWQY